MAVLDGSAQALKITAELALSRGNIDTALALVHDFVEQIITEPLCTAMGFESYQLDQLCLSIGRQNLANMATQQNNPLPDSCKNGPIVVYLVSRLQRSGGHSRLVQDFIHAQPGKNHLILSTEIAGSSDKKYLSETFAADKNVYFAWAPPGSFKSRLNWLHSILLNNRIEHVHLLNHHQDSVAVAALVPELNLNGSFIHHGDHHLCLGVHMKHLTHVDLHPMGYHYCRDELGIENDYLPLTIKDKKTVGIQSVPMHDGHLITATAARSNKVESPYCVSYLDTVPRILEQTGGTHIHIGRLTPWALHRIYHQMRKQGIEKERFVYIKWTPSVWKTLQELKVDVYIASFPFGAGLTLIEAMGAGLPVIMHRHIYSRVLSGLELAYPKAFSWTNQNQLLEHLALLEPRRIEHERRLARQHYEHFHQPKVLHTYLSSPNSIKFQVPQLSEDFKPRYDEWAALVEKQITFSHLIYRYLYRMWRKIRRISFMQ